MGEAILILLKETLQTPAYQFLLLITLIYKCGSFKDDLDRIIKTIDTQFKSLYFQTVSYIPPIFPRHKKPVAWGIIIALSFTAGYLPTLSIAISALAVLSANGLPFFSILALLALTLTFGIMFLLQWDESHKIAKVKSQAYSSLNNIELFKPIFNDC
ncbi:MAG: hypothetical protein WBA20_19545 [Ketobacter sp.]